MDIDGSDNAVTYTGTGVNASAGGYFYLDHTGGQRTFNISQWFRSVNFEFNIWSGSEFKIDEGEDMIYFN